MDLYLVFPYIIYPGRVDPPLAETPSKQTRKNQNNSSRDGQEAKIVKNGCLSYRGKTCNGPQGKKSANGQICNIGGEGGISKNWWGDKLAIYPSSFNE